MAERLNPAVESGVVYEDGAGSVAEIAAQVALLYERGGGQDRPLTAAPVLALGMFERVGSN
ncbi:hypothetical protein [Streptomyces sp. NPDC055036]